MFLLTKAVNPLEKALLQLSRRAGNIGAGVLMAMVLLTAVDVTLRRVFNSPLPFSFELIDAALVIVVFCSVAYTTSVDRHVSIDVLTSRFQPKAQLAIMTATDFFSAVLFGLITWRATIHAMKFLDTGYETGILKIPLYPFGFIVALGCALACLLLLVKVIKSITGEARK